MQFTNTSYRQLDLSSIDLDDETYLIRPQREQPDKDLIKNIRKFGILHPPLIKPESDGRYIVLSGRKRIAAVKKIDPTIKPTFLILKQEINGPPLFSLLLQHALIGGNLTIIETAFFLKKITGIMSGQDALMFLSVLGMKPHLHHLNEILSILTLPDSVIHACHNGLINQKILSRLMKLSRLDQEVACEYIKNLRLGASKQLRFIDLCTELIMRSKRPLRRILEDWPEDKNSGDRGNKPQLAANLLGWLHDECYPRTNAAERSFRHFVGTLNLPKQAKVHHTPSFEDDTLSLTLTFEDKNSLVTTWKKISKFLPYQAW